MKYFDYETMAHEAGVSEKELEEIKQLVHSDYPNDEMMFELHVLRICIAIKEGWIKLENVLSHSKV